MLLSVPDLPSAAGTLSPVSDSGGSLNPERTPDTAMVFFPVSVTPVGSQGSEAEAVEGEREAALEREVETFRASYQRPISPVLNRPIRRSRKKRILTGPVRRSSRNCGKFAPGTPVRRQQKELIRRLGIAREGERIGDEALEAYMDLFARPLQQRHIDVVLSLFGWQPDALPLTEDDPVECMV